MEVVQNGGNLDPTNTVTGNMGRFVCIFATLYDQKKWQTGWAAGCKGEGVSRTAVGTDRQVFCC